jgi:hypothetical protein
MADVCRVSSDVRIHDLLSLSPPTDSRKGTWYGEKERAGRAYGVVTSQALPSVR